MLDDKYIKNLEKKICLLVAKNFKTFTGRGPENTRVYIQEKYVLIEILGFILPVEQKMAETEQGYYDVKMNRLKWFEAKKDNYVEQISNLTGKKIAHCFCDVDPRSGTGVIVVLHE